MTPDKKRKLRNIAILSLLGLIGGTFAFTAFNQQAINDRENDVQVNVGGRVHDYYNAESENKDVFVENYGERPIMARIRLSEYLETQQTGASAPTPLVDGTERDQLNTWTPYIPSATAIGTRTGAGAAFNRYSNLRFGRAGEAPWYLPTFNHNNLDLSTAAAGDARDLADGSDDVTHPGDGTDGYWEEGVTYTNGSGPTNTVWHGGSDGATRETAQNLRQERAAMAIEQWSNLRSDQQIGDFWVVDHTTGWAYWASMLEVGEATSYLLDAAEMTAAIEDTVFNGSYYYGIHVDSQLISPDHSDDFLAGGDSRLEDFLTGIQNNSMDDEGANPRASVDSPVSAFNFDTMNPGRIFTMAGEQYRYLEDMGDGNHMIIRNDVIRNVSWNDQEAELTSWYEQLDSAVQAMVQPVADEFKSGAISGASAEIDEDFWLVNNLGDSPEVAADITQVVSEGTRRAFALSLAGVDRLSRTEGIGFPNRAVRSGQNHSWWWLRTPNYLGEGHASWVVHGDGSFNSSVFATHSSDGGGVRPALIINQAN
ncbi:DUF6273 domain-containing protein [Lactococcus formosensis]|uniref:DUF6273 domain-containing protein n=1 Tax=Lactococcus formosensis TaxID=1281486 RepID=UPI002551A23B|nr:DUF6273 domain-containing protein [Lactococcus formosensis]